MPKQKTWSLTNHSITQPGLIEAESVHAALTSVFYFQFCKIMLHLCQGDIRRHQTHRHLNARFRVNHSHLFNIKLMKHLFKNICGVITAEGEPTVPFLLQPHVKTIDFNKKITFKHTLYVRDLLYPVTLQVGETIEHTFLCKT